MSTRAPNPSFRFSTVFLVALSLSIGWGIRGNFGHEYGAMIPGALAAIAACLLSGREDWRRRVAYFAFFGALGWGFGGSISYGQVIAYTHSGHLSTQIYGFAALFVIGFLWAGLGGAGTALPAIFDRERLTQLFRPMLWIFGAWFVWELVGRGLVLGWLGGLEGTGDRQTSPLYWFDSDWVAACLAVGALCLFDFWDRIETRWTGLSPAFFIALILAITVLTLISPTNFLFFLLGAVALTLLVQLALANVLEFSRLGAFAVGGTVSGTVIHFFFRLTGFDEVIGHLLTRYQGDVQLFARADILGPGDPSFTPGQVELLLKFGGDVEAFKADLTTNWPNFFQYEGFAPHFGWVFGLMAGLAIYFALHGRFGSGSKLFLYMSVGWIIAFLLLPVLLGVRMTPPRADSWAGTLGVFIGAIIYFVRNGYASVAYASIISGAVGGIGFSGASFIKLMMVRLGNPNVVSDPDTVAAWSHWQRSNWHSFLEQSYGFINGLGIAIALALLARKAGRVSDEVPTRRWTEVFAIAFVLIYLTFVNWRKAVGTWISQGAVPEVMKMPLIDGVELSAHTWFALVYWIVGTCIILMMVRHLRRPVAVVPETWLGKGQLLFLVFLWVVVLFNNERALTGFQSGRLITEGVIFVNAALASVVLLVAARPRDTWQHVPDATGSFRYLRAFVVAFLCLAAAVTVETAVTRAMYGDTHAGHSGLQKRFGDDAEWRVNPLLHSKSHN